MSSLPVGSGTAATGTRARHRAKRARHGARGAGKGVVHRSPDRRPLTPGRGCAAAARPVPPPRPAARGAAAPAAPRPPRWAAPAAPGTPGGSVGAVHRWRNGRKGEGRSSSESGSAASDPRRPRTDQPPAVQEASPRSTLHAHLCNALPHRLRLVATLQQEGEAAAAQLGRQAAQAGGQGVVGGGPAWGGWARDSRAGARAGVGDGGRRGSQGGA